MASSQSPNSKRQWPTAAQFNEAIQCPRANLADAELRAGIVDVNSYGLPLTYAGNFADVYRVHCPATGNTWAVKFFKREVANLRTRYRAISLALEQRRLPFMVDFRYQDEGVKIGGAWYPVVKMRWIDGQNLNDYVAQTVAQPRMLAQLFGLWVKLSARLHAAGIAHADLQHGNVVLVPKDDQGHLLLRLIDYDGMFVPGLEQYPSGESGHPSYQHPQRFKEGIYSRDVDRFSHLAICCALRALRASGEELWKRYNNDENLLFREHDFANPGDSALFRELWTLQHPDARALVAHLALSTQQPLTKTPLIEELVDKDGAVRPLTTEEQHAAQALLGHKMRIHGAHQPAPAAAISSLAAPAAASPAPPVIASGQLPVGRALLSSPKQSLISPPPEILTTEIITAEIVPEAFVKMESIAIPPVIPLPARVLPFSPTPARRSRKHQNSAMGSLSLICGLLSIMCCVNGYIGVPLSLGAIATGIAALGAARNSSPAHAIVGIISGVLGMGVQIMVRQSM